MCTLPATAYGPSTPGPRLDPFTCREHRPGGPETGYLARKGNLLRDGSGVCFVRESLSCCLAGYTQSECDLVP